MINDTVLNNVTNVQELAVALTSSDVGAPALIFFSGITVLIFIFIIAGGSRSLDTREAFTGAALITLLISVMLWFLGLVPMLVPTIYLILFILSLFFLLLGG